MFPVIFEIGSFQVTSFGLMMFMSFITAAWLLGKQLERYGMSSDIAWDVLAWVAIGGILGAKLYYLVLNVDQLIADPLNELRNIRGGLVWYGGLIGGVVAYYFQVKAKKLPMATMYDATAPALAAAYAVGRLGCFLVGDDYGKYTEGWWGISFPNGAPPTTAAYLRSTGDTIPASIPDSAFVTVHPTQLYEIALAMVMFAILWRLGTNRGLKTGQLFAVYLWLYSVERFLIEFVRAKTDLVFGVLSTSQIMAIVTFMAGVALWQWGSRRGRPTPLRQGPDRPASRPAAARA